MSWYHRLARWIDSRGGCRDIFVRRPDGGVALYLRRYYLIKTPIFEAMIHQFFLSDEPILHDHPWDSCSIILGGGYSEHVLDRQGRETSYFRHPGYVGVRSRRQCHRVRLQPNSEGKVWTIFITGPRRRQWGFMTPTGWIAAPEYFRQQGVESVQIDHSEFVGWFFPVRRRNEKR